MLPLGFTIREIEDRNEETSDGWFYFVLGIIATLFVFSVLN